MPTPKIIETLSFVRSIRKRAETDSKVTLSEFDIQNLVRHIENIESAVQMQAITNNSQKT